MVITDGSPGCGVDLGYTNTVHLRVAPLDGGVATLGTYPVGAGASADYVAAYADGGLAASAGQVVLNLIDQAQDTIGGNFDVFFDLPDGGSSELSGIFSAVPCS